MTQMYSTTMRKRQIVKTIKQNCKCPLQNKNPWTYSLLCDSDRELGKKLSKTMQVTVLENPTSGMAKFLECCLTKLIYMIRSTDRS